MGDRPTKTGPQKETNMDELKPDLAGKFGKSCWKKTKIVRLNGSVPLCLGELVQNVIDSIRRM
jgi:hypothetical protein